MLTMKVSGSKSLIFANLLNLTQQALHDQGLSPLPVTLDQYDQAMGVLGEHRISHTVTLSREN